ncbi:MAG: hypothetical protein HC827_02130 [Cyanobacteria bacterium RM1_2_2]|nr:hypothetical protein [Cyanobacteria bacterium RM1_2_2]
MNALQPHPYSSPKPPRKPRVRSQSRQSRPRQSPHRAAAIEAAVKVGINFLFAAAALSALVKLIPSNLQQQEDLRRLQVEVDEASSQVASLQADFDRHFDPQQTMDVMQEQNIRFNPRQRQVVWLNPDLEKDLEAGSTLEGQE